MTDTTITNLPNLSDLLVSLEKEITEQLDTIWQDEDREKRLQRISGLIIDFTGRVKEVGKRAQHELDQGNTQDRMVYFIVFDWLDEARDFLVLLRNILFEQHRANVLFNEEQVTSEVLSEFGQTSKERAKLVAGELFEKVEEVRKDFGDLTKKINQWKLENSPWSVIEQQITVIIQQVSKINEQSVLLERARNSFKGISSHFQHTFQEYLDYLTKLTEGMELSLHPPTEDQKEVSATALIKQLRTFTTINPEPATVGKFIDQLNVLVDELPDNKTLIIDTDAGLLQQRNVNISKDTDTWLQSELMSEVQDFYNRREQINNRLLVAIRTGGNRLEFDRQEGQSLAGKEILYTVEQLIKHIRRSADSLKELEEKTLGLLQSELTTANAFSPGFLQLNMQQTLDQYRKYQQSGLTELKNWLTKKGRSLIDQGRDSLKTDSLSASEKIVNLINERKLDSANDHYTGMFVNSGYLGESFRVGREQEVERLTEIVKNWKYGFRGAVLITGSRHSGKSFFGEMIGHQFFNKRYIDLRPNTRMLVAGRTLEPTGDLEEALKFVVANSRQKKTMVLIDDLASWQDRETPLAGDITALLDNLDDHADQLFFVVVTDQVLYHQLRIHCDVDRYFQATLPMRRLTAQEIGEAIMIRHGATQMRIVDEDGEELKPHKLQEHIRSIAQRAYGHIGEGLRQWAYATRHYNEDSITLTEGATTVLDVNLTKDAGILLRAILINRATSEYKLRKEFGPLFNDKFKHLIQRYLQLGILIRRPNGLLEILPAIVGDLEKELRRQSFLPGKDAQKLEEI